MKKIVYSVVTLLMITAVSCSDFLDKNPPASLSEASFWRNKSDLNSAMTGVYASMRTGSGWMAFATPFWDNLTDNGYGQHNEGQYGLTTGIVQGNITPVTGGFIGSLYGACYNSITRANLFIAQLDKYTGSDLSQAERDVFMGEALFFRVFFYSYLYRTYGDVPIVLEPLTLETMFQPKSDAAKVAEQIHKDLDEAIRLLPNGTYSEARGRLTKNAARAFKARMLLNDAYDASGNAIPATMTAALALLNQVNGYSLSPVFTDIFQGANQNNNPEIIFSTKYLAPNLGHLSDRFMGYWVCISPLTNFVESYQFNDGTPFNANDPRFDPENPTANRDPRMAYTVNFGPFQVDGFVAPSNVMPTGYGLAKFMTRTDPHLIPGGEYSRTWDSDWVHIRYADVLLMIAEAENEVNGPNATVYNAINSLRARVNMPPIAAGLTKEQMRQVIRDERRVEMAFEGQRFFDLRRWRIIEDVMNNLREPKLPAFIPRYEKRFNKWPLPQGEIDRNRGVLVQNPDYVG